MATKTPVLDTVSWDEATYGARYRMTIEGGLHFIAGNSAPYFSLTHTTRRNGVVESCGAGHEDILRHRPQFADLAALHLSDIDGVPMHAAANGFYQLAGSLPDAFGERYHAGNQDRHFPDGYRKPTGDECLAGFADYWRLTLAEAASIKGRVIRAALASRFDRNAIAKAKLAEIMETMRARWAAEAEACIARHGLVVYGDKWERVPV